LWLDRTQPCQAGAAHCPCPVCYGGAGVPSAQPFEANARQITRTGNEFILDAVIQWKVPVVLYASPAVFLTLPI